MLKIPPIGYRPSQAAKRVFSKIMHVGPKRLFVNRAEKHAVKICTKVKGAKRMQTNSVTGVIHQSHTLKNLHQTATILKLVQVAYSCFLAQVYIYVGWMHGVAKLVTRWSQSTKLLYTGPGYLLFGWVTVC